MSKSTRIKAGSVAMVVAVAAMAMAVVSASANEPGETVTLKSKITVNPVASAGKVVSSNANCVEDRQVVVKEKGFGKIGAATTNAKGGWQAEPKYKGSVPLKVYAEVKPITQGTAGTVYKCLGATSKTVTINGG
jgi:hypothetical protein